MRYIFILMLSAFLGLSASGQLAVSDSLVESEVIAAQESYAAQNGKYVQVARGATLPGTTAPNYEAEIHEYRTATGEIGWQLFYYREENGSNYVKSLGAGPEAEARTYDWRKLPQ